MAAFRATVGDAVIARSDAVVLLEGNVYFPPDAVDERYLTSSRAKSLCPWKGTASYYTVQAAVLVLRNAAWYYPHPSPLARRISTMSRSSPPSASRNGVDPCTAEALRAPHPGALLPQRRLAGWLAGWLGTNHATTPFRSSYPWGSSRCGGRSRSSAARAMVDR